MYHALAVCQSGQTPQANQCVLVSYPDPNTLRFEGLAGHFSTWGVGIVIRERILNLNVFIEGLYTGNGKLQAVLFNNGLSSDSTACDSIIVEFRHWMNIDSIIASVKTLLHTNGTANAKIPGSVLNQSCYVVVCHRNSIETWSKEPLLFNAPIMNFDFKEQ